jgi:hypothetical protein
VFLHQRYFRSLSQLRLQNQLLELEQQLLELEQRQYQQLEQRYLERKPN